MQDNPGRPLWDATTEILTQRKLEKELTTSKVVESIIVPETPPKVQINLKLKCTGVVLSPLTFP